MKHVLLVPALVLSVSAAFGQTRQLTGVVKGPDNDALPGVTVLLKGTNIGTATGADGSYRLTIPADAKNPVIRFSFIGYVSQEILLGGKTDISLSLVSDTQSLDDVVVIGYQQVQRRDVTGAVSSVSAQQIKDIPVNSAAEALQGRLAGVSLNASDGQPGNQSFQVRVRGGNSITQDNTPLYVVDGVQVENALNVISPQDIASVDVLKDASATAIYGARGANGVVIITTKSGKEGRTTITYNGFAGFRKVNRLLSVLQPRDYVNYQYERAASLGTAGLTTFGNYFGTQDFNSPRLDSSRNAPFINWQDRVFGRSAFQQTHNISLTGGNKGMTYALSLTRNTEDGVQVNSSFDRYLLNFKLDNKVSDRFRFGVNTRYTAQETIGAGTGVASGAGTSTTSTRLRNAVQYTPFELPATSHSNASDPDVFDDAFFASSTLVNPVLAINDEYRSDKRRTLNLAGNASLVLVKDLTLRSTVGIDLTDLNTSTFNGRNSPSIRYGNYATLAFATILTGLQTSVNNSNVLDYNWRRGKHSLTGLLGEETYQQQARLQYVQSLYLPLGLTAERALANIAQNTPPSGATPITAAVSIPVDYTLLSFFARANYNYDDKYLLTLTARRDASSKFKPDYRSRFFPAASLAWRISRESFLSDIKPISDLKLRLSYGQAGNNRIADFLGDRLFSTLQDPSANTPATIYYYDAHQQAVGSAAYVLANNQLQWEITTSRNLGLDLSLFNNRVQLTGDVYYNTTSDLLINRPFPTFLGYSTQLQNIGRTSNRGLELQLSGTVVQTSDFSWTASANASFNRNRVEDLGPNQSQFLIGSGWASTVGATLVNSDYAVQVGQPVGLMNGFISDGFYTTDDFSGYNAASRLWTLKPGVANDAGVTGFTTGVAPGQAKLRDISGPNGQPDGIVDGYDRTVIGNANPKMIGGLNQQFTYKNFDASVFVNFVYGNQIYNANKIEFTTAYYPFTNMLGEVADRYRNYNDQGVLVTDVAALNALNANAKVATPSRQYFLQTSDIESGSFIRLNNITLGYSVPKTVVQKIKLSQLRFYATLNNLAIITGYSGFDPEVNTRRATPLTPGVDFAAYPRSRGFLFGLNVSL